MGKVKIKKKETRIDMTAMSDVTVLLLTFFMLTSTFLQKEPVQVITPPSVSEEKVPIEKLVTILVTQNGDKPQIYMELTGTADSTLTTEDLREQALLRVGDKFGVQFTRQEVDAFRKQNAFGLPISKMKEWLALPIDERDKVLQQPGAGIPIKMNFDNQNLTEFQVWIQAIYAALQEAGAEEEMDSGKGIAIKADQTTPYSIVEVIMNNLQTIKMNKFTLMTALKNEEE